MKIAAKTPAGKKSSATRIVDGKLILSYPDAMTPVVWQMDLAHAQSSAMEVRESLKGTFVLTLKTIKGEVADIVPFATRAEAVEALMDIARALENAQGKIRVSSVANNSHASAHHAPAAAKQGKAGRWMTAILGLLLIFVLFGVWGSLAPKPPGSIDGAQQQQSPAPGFGGNDEPGVPLSADEFLMKNR